MSLPSAWVDRLFEKLSLVYGQRFLGLYAGLNLDAVKADWADELAGFQQSPNAIRHGLENLPADHPPTVLQFRDLCRKAPQFLPKALPEPAPNPEIAKAVRQAFKPAGGYGDRAWADKLRERIKSGEIRPTKFQRDALAELEQQP